jgi:hypothetical protein
MSATTHATSRVTRRIRGAVLAGFLLTSATVYLCSTASARPEAADEIPFEDLAHGGNSRMLFPAFLVARTEADFQRIWTLHTTSPELPPDTRQPPGVDFSKYFVIAFFGGGGVACEPYRITRVLEYPERITVEITHPMQGRNCTCITILATPYEMVRIPRVVKPIDYTIKSNRVDCRG